MKLVQQIASEQYKLLTAIFIKNWGNIHALKTDWKNRKLQNSESDWGQETQTNSGSPV